MDLLDRLAHPVPLDEVPEVIQACRVEIQTLRTENKRLETMQSACKQNREKRDDDE
jgi:hypothetical protein